MLSVEEASSIVVDDDNEEDGTSLLREILSLLSLSQIDREGLGII